MKDSLLQEKNFNLIIDAYRKSLLLRYSEENIKKFPELSKIDRTTIDKLVKYFLELLYPPLEDRLKLDNAFASLSNFVHSPSKLMGVLGNIPYAVMKFGKMLFSALQAGMNALRSYLAAHRFEKELFDASLPLIEKGIDISEEKVFNSLLAKIPQADADDFRHQVVKLFEILSNQELLIKVQDVMLHVIEKMESKKNIYTSEEVEGIKLGYGIIEKGKELFSSLEKEDIDTVLKGIDIVEKTFFERAKRENM
jgi:hypothetical protein